MKQYLAKLTIYNFSKKKIKFDYSVIPIEKIFEKDGQMVAKSATSDECLYFENKDIYKPIFVNKDKDGNKISRVLKLFEYKDDMFLDKIETEINKELYKLFNKHFWYKFKHRNTLNKKIKLGQFKI